MTDNATANIEAGISNAADANAIALLSTVNNWNEGISTYGISEGATSAMREARDAIRDGIGAIVGSEHEARRYLGNTDIYPEGRQERADAARQAGQEAASEAFATADTAATVAEALLIAESAPSWGSTASEANANKQLARSDARMVLDAADTTKLPQALQSLAQLDSPMSTLVTSDWLDLYLASRGVASDEAKAMRDLTRNAALTARAARGVKSAQLVFAVRKGIRGSLGGAKSLAANRAQRF